MQVDRILGNVQKSAGRLRATAEIVNNLDWYASMSVVDFLSNVGRHFRVNSMLGKDSVRSRLQSDAGLVAALCYHPPS